MKEYYKIDSDGFYAGTVLLPDDTTLDPDLIATPLPEGLHRYKYDAAAKAWAEGATAEEIAATNAAAAEPTVEQRIDLMQAALDNLIMGV